MQNAEAEIVQLVEDLVKSYAVGNCLILVTLPMSGKYFLSETRPSSGVTTVDAVQTTLRTKLQHCLLSRLILMASAPSV